MEVRPLRVQVPGTWIYQPLVKACQAKVALKAVPVVAKGPRNEVPTPDTNSVFHHHPGPNMGHGGKKNTVVGTRVLALDIFFETKPTVFHGKR